MRALVWSSVLNGVASVPILVGLLFVAQNQRIMGRFRIRGVLAGWGVAVLMAAIAVFLWIQPR